MVRHAVAFATAKAISNDWISMGNIFDSPSWGRIVGYINSEGEVYDGVGMMATRLGRVKSNGDVYNDSGLFGTRVGKVANDGKVYTDGFLGGTCVGMVESNGKVWDDVGIGATCVGRVESPHIFGGGAALLLLIR